MDIYGLVVVESDLDAPRDVFSVWASERCVAHFAKADDPNEKWITMHPHGDSSSAYVHVKIRINPHDGSAHIINGPNELRGLRISRLSSPEQVAQRRKEREKKRAELKKQKASEEAERIKNDPEYAKQVEARKTQEQDLEKRRQDIKGQIQEVTKNLLHSASKVTGDQQYQEQASAMDDPEAAKRALLEKARDALSESEHELPQETLEGAVSTIHKQNLRGAQSSLNVLHKTILRELIQDPELRQAVMQEGEKIDPTDLQSSQPSGHPGYQVNTSNQAAEQGFGKEDAEREADQVFAQRAEKLGEKAASDVLASGGTAEQAEQAKQQAVASAHNLRNATRERAKAVSAVKPVAGVKTSTKLQDLSEKAESTREFLQHQQQLADLKRQLRSLELAHDPHATPEEKDALSLFDQAPAKGSDMGIDVSQPQADFNQKLQESLTRVKDEDLTRAFLNAVDDDGKHVGYGDEFVRRAMHAHIGSGAYSHLSNVAVTIMGSDGLDRQVIDALGVNAAAQVMAYALQQHYKDDPEGFEQLKVELGNHHYDHTHEAMQQAIEDAEKSRDLAAQIQVPEINSGTDAALVKQLQKQKSQHIDEAQRTLGTALGQLEVGAALNQALGAKQGKIQVNFGMEDPAKVALQLRALGLEDGDYSIEKLVHDEKTENGRVNVTLSESALQKLAQMPSEQDARNALEIRKIKSGVLDEQNYLPAGFMARNPSDLTEHPRMPAAFATAPDFSMGIAAGVRDAVASRYADGWTPKEIFTHLMDVASQHVSADQLQAYAQHVTSMFPFAKSVEKTAQDGTRYTAMEAVDLDNHPEVKQKLSEISQKWLQQHHPGEADFHGQQITDDEPTREALFRALTQNPALQAAFADASDIGGSPKGRQTAKAIRKYFLQNIHKDTLKGKTPDQFDAEQKQAREQELKKLGPEPEKWGEAEGMMFGGFGGGDSGPKTLQFTPTSTPEERIKALEAHGLKPEHYSIQGDRAVLNADGEAVVSPPTEQTEATQAISGGLDGLNPDWVQHKRRSAQIRNKYRTTKDLWTDFVDTMRNPTNAYRAVQEVMQNELIREFHAHHGQLTGRSLKVSKETTQHWERRLSATDPQKAQQVRQRDQKLMDGLKERDSSGRYLNMGEGGLLGAAQKHLEKMHQQSLMQGGLGFDLFGSQGGGEVQAQDTRHLEVGDHERLSLGHAAESRLKQMLKTDFGLDPAGYPVKLINGLTWGTGTKHVHKQRAVKMLLHTGRLLGFFGAGSGKTSIAIGGFTEAHAQGRAKKGLIVVPSIVKNQFGEEMSRFTKPGQYKWHAGDADFEGRLKAYQDPETHMVVATHQSFRDDMVKIMSMHHALTPEESTKKFMSASRTERAQMLGEALKAHNIPTDYVSYDEAHETLNRAGKADSLLSMVTEAVLDNSKIRSVFTGSPVKNDTSEIYDWLHKIHPERFNDRDGFHRRYGVGTQASKEALRRLVEQYAYVDSVTPDVQRTVTWGMRDEHGQEKPIPLSDHQKKAYQDVEQAYTSARRAYKKGQVDVQAARVLNPKAFKDVEADQHEEVARRIHSALGTARFTALNRIVNDHDPEHNAKLQHALKLCEDRKGTGGVIFAHHKETISNLKAALEAKGHKVGLIDGSMNPTQKAQARQDFNGGKVDIILCSDAGAVGANLQGRGRYLINYDLPMTQKTLEQRNARIDRLGQENAIELHHLKTDTDFDHENHARLERKRELGSILQGQFQNLDDTGIASYILHQPNAAD